MGFATVPRHIVAVTPALLSRLEERIVGHPAPQTMSRSGSA